MAVISIEFQEQNCSYKVFGWTMDGNWLLDLAAQEIYLHIASKWLFYVPKWHLANCWYSHLLSWGGWHADVTPFKTCERPWGCISGNSHTWHWRLYLDVVLSRRIRWALHENWKKGNKKSVINIDVVKHQIEQELAGDIDINKFCAALLGLHAFTGCDSVSAFTGKGKAKCYNLLRKNLEFVETLKSLGENWNVTDEVTDKMEMFCCSLYVSGWETNVNKLRSTVQKEENLNVSSCLHVNSPWWSIFKEPGIKLVLGRCH